MNNTTEVIHEITNNTTNPITEVGLIYKSCINYHT